MAPKIKYKSSSRASQSSWFYWILGIYVVCTTFSLFYLLSKPDQEITYSGVSDTKTDRAIQENPAHRLENKQGTLAHTRVEKIHQELEQMALDSSSSDKSKTKRSNDARIKPTVVYFTASKLAPFLEMSEAESPYIGPSQDHRMLLDHLNYLLVLSGFQVSSTSGHAPLIRNLFQRENTVIIDLDQSTSSYFEQFNPSSVQNLYMLVNTILNNTRADQVKLLFGGRELPEGESAFDFSKPLLFNSDLVN